jgi:CrcB protein
MNFQGAMLVGLGGCIGCVLRYALGTQLPFDATKFAWATFAVNMLGCLLIGLGMVKIQDENLKLLLVTGMLGGFTTFSGFGYELYQYAQAQEHTRAFIYGLFSVSLGYFLVIIGRKFADVL